MTDETLCKNVYDNSYMKTNQVIYKILDTGPQAVI